jgi:nicotinamidase-related amidase
MRFFRYLARLVSWKKPATKKLTAASTGVLLIDMQEHYLSDMDDRTRGALINAQREVIDICVERDIPLFILEYKDRGPTVESIMASARNVQHLTKIRKPLDDGFECTKLDEALKGLGIKSLVLMGVSASWCVKSTAISAVRLRYEVFTTAHLIANCRYVKDNPDRWYIENGVLYGSIGFL